MEFFLVTTDHLESQIWFKDDQDFIVAMNAVPLIGYSTGVFVVVFVLMSSHVHFLLYSTYEQALEFINDYKGHYSHYLSHKYGVKETLRRNSVQIKKLDVTGEALKRAIAYVQMNPVAAGICLNPFDYPWGTGNCFFKVSSLRGTPVESLSARSRYALFHSRKDVPGGLLLGDDGFILPESYVAIKMVEDLFRTPKSMQHFLNTSSKARLRIELGASEIPSFKDQVILPMMQELCWKLFGKGSVRELSPEQLTELFRQMRYRFSSNINQMARLTGLSYEEVARLLD